MSTGSEKFNLSDQEIDRVDRVKRKAKPFLNVRLLEGMASWLKKRRVWQHQKIVRNALPKVRKQLKAFKQLKVVDSKVHKDLYKRLIKHETKVAVDGARRTEIESRVSIMLVIPTVILMLVTPYALIGWLGVWEGWFLFFGIWYASLILYLVLICLLLTPLIITSSKPNRLGSKLFVLFWFVFGLITYGYVFYHIYLLLRSHEIAWHTLVAASAILQIFLYIIGVLLAVAITSGLTRVLEIRQMAHAPDSLFIDKVLTALAIITSNNGAWADIIEKNKLMVIIESAARIISEKIPSAMKTRDSYTDIWFQDRCNAIAASLRAKKIWICMPESDTQILLEENLSRQLLHAISGNWGEIDTSPSFQPFQQSVMVRMRTFVSGLFQALLPSIVYFSAQKLHLITPGAMSEYLGFGVVLWAVIAIVVSVDPRFGDKIEAFGKIAAGIPGLLKKSDK